MQGRLSFESLSGPLTIYEVAGEEGRKGPGYFIWVMAVLSINLGLLNLLPIPVLDGGHLMFFGVEALLRRLTPLRVREISHLVAHLAWPRAVIAKVYTTQNSRVHSTRKDTPFIGPSMPAIGSTFRIANACQVLRIKGNFQRTSRGRARKPQRKMLPRHSALPAWTLCIGACTVGPAVPEVHRPAAALAAPLATGSVVLPASNAMAARPVSAAAPTSSEQPSSATLGVSADATVASDAKHELASSAASTKTITGQPEFGRIACGNTSCQFGQEVCCRSIEPNTAKSICIRVEPEQLAEQSFEYSLRSFCETRQASLVACDESKSCGKQQVCCQDRWTAGSWQATLCTPLDPTSRVPCGDGEPCVPGVPCRTVGATCVNGWCVIKRPNRPIRCGKLTCTAAKPICCARGENRERLECSTVENCQAPDASYSCTQPSDCLPDYFCGASGYGGGCTLSFGDGMTQILCNTFVDCPRSFRERCKANGQSTVCEKGAPSFSSEAQGICSCSD